MHCMKLIVMLHPPPAVAPLALFHLAFHELRHRHSTISTITRHGEASSSWPTGASAVYPQLSSALIYDVNAYPYYIILTIVAAET